MRPPEPVPASTIPGPTISAPTSSIPTISAPTIQGALVLVSSPTSRCGTTLVQRLLCSSPDALVFGEPVGLGLVELVQGLARRTQILARADEHRADLARALAGEQFWYPHLLGDAAGFVELFRESLERFVRFHAAAAAAHGRPRWGAKLPTVPIETLQALRAVCPESKLVYVMRDLVAAARSAKARRFLRTTADFERFAALWCEGAVGVELLRADPGVLVLDYEDFEQRGTSLLTEIEAFTGLQKLDPAVLFKRVNTWEGEPAEGHAPDQYLDPSTLTAQELKLLRRAVRSAHPRSKGEIVPSPRT